MTDETYYTVLGVDRTATAAKIKSAYHELMKEVHSDKFGNAFPNASPYWKKQAEERSKDINEAYAVLSHPDKRRLYDQLIDAHQRSQAKPSPSAPNRPTANYRTAAAGASRTASQAQQQRQAATNPPPPQAPPPRSATPNPPQAPAHVATSKSDFNVAKFIGILVVAGIVIAVLGNLISQIQPPPPPTAPQLQAGTVATASAVNGWRSYTPQNSFRPGDSLYVYAEALNINHSGRTDVSFSVRVTGPNGVSLPAMSGQYAKQTNDAASFFWPQMKLPADAPVGKYRADVSIRDNLANQEIQSSTQFTVLQQADSLNIEGKWQGSFDTFSLTTNFEVQIQQTGTLIRGRVQERSWGQFVYADINGSFDGNQVRFEKTYTSSPGVVTYTGQVNSDQMSGSWSGQGFSGTWQMKRIAIAEDNQQPLTSLPVTAGPTPAEQASENALRAFQESRLIEPSNDSALYWARQARQLGAPEVGSIEQSVLDSELVLVEDARRSKNYDRALSIMSQLTTLYPDHPELQKRIIALRDEQREYRGEQERQQREAELQQRSTAEYQSQPKRFTVQHRHVTGIDLNRFQKVSSYCQGVLAITPDGHVTYDCNWTNDPRNRCDHVSFPPGTIREANLRNDGGLHLSTKGAKFDFYGGPASEALKAILPFVQK